MNELDIWAEIADLKEIDYRNTLAIASLIDILIEKGIINRNDVAKKSRQLDSMSIEELRILRTRQI